MAWSRKYGDDASAAAGSEGAPGLWLLTIDRLLVAPDVDQVRGGRRQFQCFAQSSSLVMHAQGAI